jgi:N-acetylmuramoyl-L-alanine amidase
MLSHTCVRWNQFLTAFSTADRKTLLVGALILHGRKSIRVETRFIFGHFGRGGEKRGVNLVMGLLILALGLIGACDDRQQVSETKTEISDKSGVRQSPPHGDSIEIPIDRSAAQKKPFVTLKRIDTYGAFSLGQPEKPSEKTIRVVLLLDADTAYRRSELDATDTLPRRIFLDLESVRLDSALTPVVSVATKGLHRIRAFLLNESTTRVSFDVDNDTGCRIFYLTNPYRIVMDFYPPERANKSDEHSARNKTIVLDPGHGGDQPGARGPNGLKESVLTLDLAKRIYRGLRRQLPSSRVILTRQSDRSMSLEERTAIANGYAADLFVSIHFNGSSAVAEKGGVSTFILDTTDDEQALRLAARENDVSEQEVTKLQKILASLCRADQVSRSLKLAEFIHRETLLSGRKVMPNLIDRGIRRALFFVLVGARMPAILLEASFITRPEEATALETDRYRQLLADGVTRGLVRFLKNP